MSRALVILVISAAVGACRDDGLARLEAIRNEVCACKDPTCGEAAMTKVPAHEIKSNHRTQKIARSMLDCLARLYDQTRPTTDPDAEAPAPSDPSEPSDQKTAVPASAGTR